MLSRSAFRDAMARLAAAVNVVTSDGPAGRAGFTASAICSVTDEPPTLLVCMNRSSRYSQAFKVNRVLCVNVLGPEHRTLSKAFANPDRDLDACFATATWEELATGSPALTDAVATFDCRVRSVSDIGTHSVFISEVAAVRSGSLVRGLIYFNRAYHAVAGSPGV